MKDKIKKIVIGFIATLTLTITAAGVLGLEGTQPPGMEEKILKLCDSEKQNCVSSLSLSPYHRMDIFETNEKNLHSLVKIIEEDPQAKVIIKENDYVYAQYKSKFFRFVDDVQFLLLDDGKIEFVSASRLGRKDFEVNRARIEKLRKKFIKQ